MWYTEYGKSGDVVLSSRVRLARNIKDIPFAGRMSEEQQKQVLDICKDSAKSLKFIDLSSMDDYEKKALAECHLISPEMVSNTKKRGILISDDSRTCVMLNEEDHIRIQCMTAGLDLDECLSRANEVDDELEEKLDYGFSEKYGYLTCCPTNVGTGMRASVMMHLPALVISEKIDGLTRSLAKLGITVRGIFGEGSKALGNIFQISNQVTLGVTEEETIQKLNQAANEIIEKERELRKSIYENNKYKFEDRVMRAYGILTNARLLKSSEAMALISDVRFGINMGIIKDSNLEKLSEVMYASLPANIVKAYNITSAAERDLKRAELIQEQLKK